MRRRDFVKVIAGTAATWPLTARAQQPMSVVGFLDTRSTTEGANRADAFRQGLGEAGFVAGRNITIEYRWAEGQDERLPALIADLIQNRVMVIAGMHSTAAVRLAKGATTAIPIVFAIGGDPVKNGLVASLNRPGGNVTGVSYLTNLLGPKRLELLHELIPNASVIAVLVNPNNPNAEPDTKDMQAAARALGLQIHVLNASSERDIETAFESLVQHRADALLHIPDPLFLGRGDQIIALAARYAVPYMPSTRELVAVGGLMSYGPSITDAYHQVGVYTGRILKGENPADLPIVQPTKFELVINLKTAKTLGIEIPAKLLALADEVIE